MQTKLLRFFPWALSAALLTTMAIRSAGNHREFVTAMLAVMGVGLVTLAVALDSRGPK